jgi:chromosome segregation ATPase
VLSTDGTENHKKSLEEIQKDLSRSEEQCKVVSAERDLLKRELSELRTAAQAVVDLVDPFEEGALASKTLVERLRGAPQRIASYLAEASKQCIAHVQRL